MVDKNMQYIEIGESKLSKFLFSSSGFAWFWLFARVYVGYEWFMAGWGKLGNAVWTGDKAGVAITGFLQGALSKTSGPHPDVSGWYAWFLQNVALPHASFFSHLVVYGELLVGIALILGVFTGIAAFFGSFMNLNYLFAGTVSINPLLLLVQLFLILAWKCAGHYGLDKYLLPALGTPWERVVVSREVGK